MTILLGAIADDFTGATDLCNTLVKEGMRTVQTIGVPPAGLAIPEADAVVVALKSRTCPPGEAVAMSLEALAWLRAAGARQILFKYCSTFDSTDRAISARWAMRSSRRWRPASPSPAPPSPKPGARSIAAICSSATRSSPTPTCATTR